jgi:hypothetical protein
VDCLLIPPNQSIDHHTQQARENAPAILKVRRLAAGRSHETLAVTLLQPEGEDMVARAHFLMTLGTLSRFKVRGFACLRA